MFDFDLIERCIGATAIPDVSAWEDYARARAEFAKLRTAIKDAPVRQVRESATAEGYGHITRIGKTLVGASVRLVRED